MHRKRNTEYNHTNLGMKLLFGSSVAILTKISILTLRWVSPVITVFDVWTRSRPEMKIVIFVHEEQNIIVQECILDSEQ